MQTFLEKLADEILSQYKERMQNVCVVFPSRRAGIYFRKYVSQKLDTPVWSPSIFSIDDFVRELSPYNIPESGTSGLKLIFELYESYRKYGEDESFDRFYPWGEMILRDFDEIDKNLAPAEYIFKVIKEFKNVEEEFSPVLGDLGGFKAFWETFSKRELSEIEKEFIKTWEILGDVYGEFKKRLAAKNLAYEGMAYRKLCDDIKSGSVIPKWEKIYFAGFNYLYRSEENIVKEMLKKGVADFYLDADEYYFNDTKQEAGKFLRQDIKNLKLESPKWIESNLLPSVKKKKNISVIGAALQEGQAKALGECLYKLALNSEIDFQKCAVILPDETLLIPVLYSIPEEVKAMNVTMGFPLRNAPLYSMILLLRALQKNKRVNSSGLQFYHKNVIELLMHPYVKFFAPAFAYELVNDIKRNNIIYITSERIFKYNPDAPDIFKLVFTSADSIEKTLDYLFGVLDTVARKAENPENTFAKFESEYFTCVYEQLNGLKEVIGLYGNEMSQDTFWSICLEVLRSVRVPFTGEPLKGLQVMGLLETRALDFENVFILSMNEGIMPKGITQSSFIPYNLRKAFNLPVYEDEDAKPAYYFYRLLQRAKNVYLFYDTEAGNFSAGEKSRFLLQIENELVQMNPSINYENCVMETGTGSTRRKEIIISKNDEIIQKLKNVKYFTTSDLINYITCSLKFYLKKIAGLKEEEEVEEYFTSAVFGNIFHKMAQLIYAKHTGVTLGAEEFDKIAGELNSSYDEKLSEAFRSLEGLKELEPELQGINLLYKGVIKKLLHKLIENDKEDAPFKITGLEKEVRDTIDVNSAGGKVQINLQGRIDRVDETSDGTRIIDYKTGTVKVKQMSSKIFGEEYFDRVFSDVNYKESFQAYFYALLSAKENYRLPMNIAIYPVKNMGGGIEYINGDSTFSEDMELFVNRLNILLQNIFDKNIAFSQTEDEERCRYCPYKGICYRD